jgi:hypothetical protein
MPVALNIDLCAIKNFNFLTLLKAHAASSICDIKALRTLLQNSLVRSVFK